MTGTEPGGRPDGAAMDAAVGTGPDGGRPLRHRARRLALIGPTATIGAVLWVFLWGDLSWANVLSGMVLGALVALAFPLPRSETHVTVRPGPLLRLVGHFFGDLVLASFQVAWTAVTPGGTPRGALVTVQLRSTEDLFVATTSGLSSMVPGTMVVDLDHSTGIVRLHVLDLDRSGGAAAVRDATRDLEERLLRAFAPRAELIRMGLADASGRPTPPTPSAPPSPSGKEEPR